MLLRSISRRKYKSLKSRESGAGAWYELGASGAARPGAGGFAQAKATCRLGRIAVLLFLWCGVLVLLLGGYYVFLGGRGTGTGFKRVPNSNTVSHSEDI